MKKLIFIALIVLTTILCLAFSSQEIKEETFVVNVEVPVRVFSKNTFVDNLTIDDFEVYQDGKLQKVEAVYLIKKTSIERREEKKRFAPQISRHFFLWFDISEYMPRIGEAIDYFLDNVLFLGDSLVVVTPMKTYYLKSKALEIKPKEEIAEQLKGIIRRDATIGNSEYRAVLKDLQNIVKVIEAKGGGGQEISSKIGGSGAGLFDAGSLEEVVQMYSSVLIRLENLRKLDQQKLLYFAKFLKNKEGQKHIFLFYQREFLPQIHHETLAKFMGTYQDKSALLFSLSDTFKSYKRDVSIDVERVKQAFADSSLSIHFLFIKKTAEHRPGLEMQEQSEDIFLAFKEMALATGGLAESFGNPAFAVKRAVEAFENYYLLYYSPLDYKKDGKFKKIKVRVKNKKYKITYRVGYFAD